MLVNFTDGQTNKPIAINSNHVVIVFTSVAEDGTESTVISVLNGNVVVKESYLNTLGKLQSNWL